MDCFDLAQDKDRQRVFVIAAINHRVPQNAGEFID
jgi:hypothetical protein